MPMYLPATSGTVEWLARGLAALLVAGSATTSLADPVADFYRGRTLSVVSGFTPNGEYDSYMRLMGRHISRFIPGQPQVVASSMPGAGTMILANHLYRIAPSDGTMIGMFAMQTAVEPFLKGKAAVFDPLKFQWIGSLTKDDLFCGVVPGPGVPTTFEELMQKETLFGGAGPTSEIHKSTAAVKNVLGAKIRLVSGYTGMPDVKLALQRGEVNGVCGLGAAALRRQHMPELASGRLKLLLQISGEPNAQFGKVPIVFDLARNDEQRDLVSFFFRTLMLAKPIAVAPGVPAERVAALRAAFDAVIKDSAFLAEAKSLNMIIDPVPASALIAEFQRLAKHPDTFFDKVRAAQE